MSKPQLPNRQWRAADGWVIRNLTNLGNSVVPIHAILSMYLLYGEDWQDAMEGILTRILRDQGVLDDTQNVWITHSKIMPRLWIAWRINV